MARDTSLTDFGSDDDPESAEGEGAAVEPPSETESTSEAIEGTTSGPAESTAGGADGDDTVGSGGAEDEITRNVTTNYTVTGDDRPCDRCCAVGARRWRDDGALVCGDCKDW